MSAPGSSYQSWVDTLKARDVEPTRKLQVLAELRETIEFSNPEVYTEFLQVFFPIFKSILESDSTQSNEEKKFKATTLDLVAHLPQDACLEPYAPVLLKTCLGLLQSSTNDLGTPCIKLIFGLYRHFRNTLFPYVRELVDFLIFLYQNVRSMVNMYFLRDSSQQSSRSSIEASYSQASTTSQRNFKSTESFRVLVECPLLVLYLVQLYPEVAKSFLPSLVTSMFDTVSLDASEPQDSSLKPVFQDFILCQVKIVQFFSFLIKDFYEYVQFLDKSIANVIVRLLRRCPSECVQSRKELLVATRHILGTSLRSSFAAELENLIDESTLFGSSEFISESVMSLGYSFLAELVHLMRQDLSYDILKRVVSIFCKNILNTSLSLPVQFTSAKLLVSLSETAQNQSEGSLSKKALFARIIATFVERFESLIERISLLADNSKYVEEQQIETNCVLKGDNYSWILSMASFEQLERLEHVLTTSFLTEFSNKDSKVPKTVDVAIIEREELHRNQIEKEITDCKLLVKTMMQGIRTLLSSLQLSDTTDSSNIGSRPSHGGGVLNAPINFSSRKLTEEECLLMIRLLLLGCNCLSNLRKYRMTDEKEEKELVNLFSHIFTELNPKSFQEIFSVCVSKLCSSILEQPFVLQIFQHLIASQHISKFCVNILLSYLTQHLYLLETDSVPSSGCVSTDSLSANAQLSDSKDLIESSGNNSVYLNLFKTLFASVTLFTENEAALRPYIFTIVKGSLNRAKGSSHPYNYFRLLRAFFKSLTGGKFELLYKDMIPLLRVILVDLVSFLETGLYDAYRDLLIELCLTIPARPSSILPHLTLHMRPLMLALQSDSPDIILLGLRTLEFWIEMLHPEYLESILETMQPTFMQALWNGVYNSSQRLSSSFLKILGKLGGTCRKYGSDILSLQLHRRQGESLYLQLLESNVEGLQLNMKELIEFCSDILEDSHLTKTLQIESSNRDSLDMRKYAYFLLKSLTLLLIANDFSSQQQMTSHVKNIVGSVHGRKMLERVLVGRREMYMRDSFYYFRNKERKLLTELVRDIACIAANSTLNSFLSGDPQTFFHQLLEYFVYRFILMDAETTSIDNYAVPLSIVVALFQLIEDGSFDMMEFSLSMICRFFQVFKDILGADLFRHHPVLIFCLNSFIHMCYSKKLSIKAMALKGILLSVENIDDTLILNPLSDVFFLHILRGVFSVIRDSEEYPTKLSFEIEQLKGLLISKTTGEQQTWEKHSFPLELYTLFASELCSSAEGCRLFVQKLITEIANALEMSILDVFNITFDQCLKILLMKSIRFSSFGKQVAYISTTCFLLETGIITPDSFGLGIQGDDEFERATTRKPEETSSEQRIADFYMLLKNILIIADDSTHNRLVEADDMALYKLVDNRLTDEGVIRFIVPLKIQCLKFIRTLITCVGSHFRSVEELASYLNVWTSNKACNELLQKINKILFQSLESNNEEISCLSMDCLQLLIEQHCLSKEDLHNNLKPLLSAFGDSHKLSVRCLHGLERVLGLFSGWFNRAIIEKLLEHLKVFIHSCTQNQEPSVNLDWRLPVGVARIFSKLPPSVIEYQDAFFKSLLQLEDFVNISTPPLKTLDSARSVSFSPFRDPMLSFCNAFPRESLDYLFKMIANERFRHLFVSFIEAKDAEPLRKVLIENYVKYIEMLVEDGVSGLEWPSVLVGIVVIRVLATWQPSWLQDNMVVYNSLHRLWQVFFVQSLFSEDFSNDLEYLDASRQLIQIVILYYCRNPYQMDVLFLLFSLFGRERHLMDFTFVKKFLNNSEQEYGIAIPSVEVFKHFLQIASDGSSPPFVLSSCLQLYLIPSLERSFRDSPEAIQIPKYLLEALVNQLLDSHSERWSDDGLSSELLRLSTLLIIYIPNELLEFRKELIKFGWDNLKKDDSYSKYWAFVMISRFFEAFQAPEKVVCQVFLALLRAWNTEGKVLTRHALSIITPIIPLRVSDEPTSGKAPTIARYTRKILSDEGFSCPRLAHIWYMISKYPLMFYPTRSLFIPLLTGALKKFTSSANTMLEFRRMILDLVRLLLKWEFWSKEEEESSNKNVTNSMTDQDVEEGGENVNIFFFHSKGGNIMENGNDSSRYLVDLSQKIVFRLTLLIMDNFLNINDLLMECYAILSFSCRIWHHFDLNIHQLESLVNFTSSRSGEIATEDTGHDGGTSSLHSSGTSTGVQNEIRREDSKSHLPDSSPTLSTSRNASITDSPSFNEGSLHLKYCLAWILFHLASKYHDLDFFKERFKYIKFLVKACARGSTWEVVKVIGKVLKSIPDIDTDNGKQYLDQLVHDLCTEVKDAGSPMDNILWLRNVAELLIALLPLNIAIDDTVIEYLTKVLIQAVKERSSGWIADRRLKEASSHVINKKDSDNERNEAVDHLISLLIGILSDRLSFLHGEERRYLMQSVIVIIDNCSVEFILKRVLESIRLWICGCDNPDDLSSSTKYLATKEKVQLIGKLHHFERNECAKVILDDFYRLLMVIFSQRRDEFQEYFSKLERTLACGLSSRDWCIHRQLVDIWMRDEKLKGLHPFDILYWIVSEKDWESFADYYWLSLGSELVLENIEANSIHLYSQESFEDIPKLCETSDSMQVDSDYLLTYFDDIERLFKKGNEVTWNNMKETLQQLVKYCSWTGEIIWKELFSFFWKQSDASRQTFLEESVCKLVAKRYHSIQRIQEPNVVQSILTSVEYCGDVFPRLAPEILAFLGIHFRCHSICLRLLQKRVQQLFPVSVSSSTVLEESTMYEWKYLLDAKAAIYKDLQEWDSYWETLKQLQSDSEYSRDVFLMMELERWNDAQHIALEAMNAYQEGGSHNLTSNHIVAIEEAWIESAKQLNQWDILTDFSRSVVHTDLLHECLWRLPDWAALKEVSNKYPVDDNFQLKIYQISLHLQENKLENVGYLFSQGYQELLNRFKSISRPMHVEVLNSLSFKGNLLVELEESSRILLELNSFARNQVYEESRLEKIFQILTGWRERLPNQWEYLTYWNELLTWRSHMYTVLVNAFQAVKDSRGFEVPSNLLSIGVNESAWSVNTLAKVARKQGLTEVCLQCFQKMYHFPTMHTTEYFTKVKQQAKSSLQLECFMEDKANSSSLQFGLNQINSCNVENFGKYQQAQLLILKAKLHHRLGYLEDANQMFATALSHCGDLSSGWLSWGEYCDDIFTKSRDFKWAAAAVNCYFQAITFGSKRSRMKIARILRLFSLSVAMKSKSERPGTASVTETTMSSLGVVDGVSSSQFKEGETKSSDQPDIVNIFEQHLNVLPTWVWIPWIAELICMLTRKEGLVLYKALVKVAQAYPQAIFYTLRSFMEERKLVDRPEKMQSVEAVNYPRRPIQALPDTAAEKYAREQKKHAELLKKKYEELQELYRTGQWGTNYHPSEAERLLQEAKFQAEQAAARAQTAMLSYEKMHLGSSNNSHLSFSQGSKQYQSEAALSSFDGRDSQGSMSSSGVNASEENTIEEDNSQATVQPSFVSPFEIADHIMLQIVEKNHLLYMDLERLCSELSVKLKSQPEEQLYSLMNVVLQRCSQVSLHSSQKEISSSVRAALEEVSKLCFGTGLSERGEFRVPYYLSDLKESFEREVAPQTAENFPNDVDELIVRLQRWKKIIQQRIERQHNVRYLERLSRYLVDAFGYSLSSSIEVFGFYHGWTGEPPVESFPRIDRLIPHVIVNNEGGSYSRRIQILGTDGMIYHFIAESSVSASLQRAEERTSHLLTLISELCLERHTSTTRRRLRLKTLHSIPTGTHSRLLVCNGRPMNVSLMQPILDYCSSTGIELDKVTGDFREHYGNLLISSGHEEWKDKMSQKEYLIQCRLKAFEKIIANYIPKNILEEWFTSHMKDIASLFQLQKEFSASYAVNCCVQYFLGLGCRKPQNILLDDENGTVIFAGLRTLLSNRRVVESEDAVPFRLTPNISNWLRCFGHLGYFFTSFQLSRMAIFERAKLLKLLLEYFVREDIISLYASKQAATITRGTDSQYIGQTASSKTSSRTVQYFMEWNEDILSDVESKLHESIDWISSRLGETKDDRLPSLRNQVEDSQRLIADAEDWKNICQMESNWLPWY
ncbi:hypothetical protein GpartN1_g850.t1 [Galdieria partita]|uniref:Non-specific serine/threonine protein kinase n=1 Tax=Galdieria partita TaxID=83374 RepID=A0A9C7PRC8_9RHOD|nr:hypothetical protein GpartN1_g850.t1 [Galdieria partita]